MSSVYSVGATVPLVLLLSDGATNRYPRVEVFPAGASAPGWVLDLTHVARGRYESSFVPSQSGTYVAVFTVYSDPSHTVEDVSYPREQEQIIVTNDNLDGISQKLIRLLGLSHENAFIDSTVYDASGQLVSARLRIFDSRDHAVAATDGGNETAGLIAVYEITSRYEDQGLMSTYRMVRV